MKLTRVIALNAALSILLLEFAIRILAMFPADSKAWINDPDVGYRMRPNIVLPDGTVSNSSGFNDVDHETQKKEGHARIAVLGDSFVFGIVPRSNNIVSIIEKFANTSNDNIEVLNMGIPAAGPKNYLALLRKNAILMNVDVACVIFFIGNDIVDSHPDFEVQVWLGSPRVTLRQPYLVGLSKEYYYVYRLLRRTIRHIREWIAAPTDGTFSEATYLSIEHQRLQVYEIEQRSHIRDSYSESIKLIGEMAAEAAKSKMKFLIVLAPDEIQVNSDLRNSVVMAYDIAIDEYDFGQPQRSLVNRLEEMGIAVLDLLPAFLAEMSAESLYAKHDSHWNEAGNRLAAEEIWMFLNDGDRGLLAPASDS